MSDDDIREPPPQYMPPDAAEQRRHQTLNQRIQKENERKRQKELTERRNLVQTILVACAAYYVILPDGFTVWMIGVLWNILTRTVTLIISALTFSEIISSMLYRFVVSVVLMFLINLFVQIIQTDTTERAS